MTGVFLTFYRIRAMVICIGIFLLPSYLIAQPGTNSVWNFGFGCRISFTSGNPLPGTSVIQSGEGSASISDENGQLLFYTNGIKVWDSNDQLIGDSLEGGYSSSQSALIIPVINSPGRYYIFTAAEYANGGIHYSILNLNNGTSPEFETFSEVLLDSSTEHLSAYKTCLGDYWIVAHQWDSDKYYSWKITATGINSPVVSRIGDTLTFNATGHPSGAIGQIKISSNGKQLAVTHSYTSPKAIELYDFDSETGLLSNMRSDTFPNDSLKSPYGLAFSPDNSKLYLTYAYYLTQNQLFQYSTNSSTSEAFILSRQVAANTTGQIATMETAPDGKIYIVNANSTNGSFLSRINQPDSAAANCGFIAQGAPLSPGCSGGFGLQNSPSFYNKIIPSNLIAEDSVQSCGNEEVAIGTSYNDENLYWSTGATDQEIMVSQSGMYYLTYSNDACNIFVEDSVYLTVFPVVSLGKDTGLCTGQEITLNGPAQDLTYQWSDGSSGNSLIISTPGNYWLTISDAICTLSDTIEIADYAFHSLVNFSNVFSPNGDGINDLFEAGNSSLENYRMLIYNRWGNEVFNSDDPSLFWDGTTKMIPAAEGVYFFICSALNECAGESILKKGTVTLLR